MARAFTPIENLFDSAKKAATRLVTRPHPWLSFRLGNSRSPRVSNQSPSAPAYAAPSVVADLPYLANSEESDGEFERRITALNNELQHLLEEKPTLQEVETSTIPQNITGNAYFYRTYGDRAIYEIPLEELAHEVVFLRLLNKLPGLSYDEIKKGIEAAVRLHPDITPIELFHRCGYRTYFSPTSSTGYPDPSPIPESFSNPFRTIESAEQPHARDSYNNERAEQLRTEVVDLTEEEGSTTPRNNDVIEEGSVASRNSEIREEGSVDSSNINNRGEREYLVQSENATPPPGRQENQELHQEEQITPKLPVDQSAVPKRVTFTPGPLANTMEGEGQSSGCDEQQDRLAEFETIYRTLIEQNISSEIATLAASKVLSGTRSSGPRYTSTPHCQPSQPRTQQVSCNNSSQTTPLGNQLNSTAVQTETKEYNETTTRKISDIDKQGAQLLTQIQIFKNKGDGMDFESWIRHFENTLDIGDFEESRKIKYLVSKLMGPAGDFVEQYRLDPPVEASCYKTMKRALKDRFMGKNIEYKFQASYDNCKREAGESVRAFAYRVQKLLRKGYPSLVEGKNQKSIEQFSRHKLIDGLSVDLQDRLLFLEFTSFDQLIKAAERHDTALEQRDARKKREMINAMNILPKTRPPTPTRQSDQLIMDSLNSIRHRKARRVEGQFRKAENKVQPSYR